MHDPTASEHARLVQSVIEQAESISGEVSPEVATSWRRCVLHYRLDPLERPEPAVVERVELGRRRDELSSLLEFAAAEMSSLYQQVSGSGYAIMLTDLDGVILNYVGDPQFTAAAQRSGLHNGSVWSEAVQGTNGIGTCIATRKPLVVRQREHFLSRHTGLTCCAAPIRNPRGEMVAVLDASCESRFAQQHTMALVNMSAQTIENRMFLSAFQRHYVLRFHSRPEFVRTLGEGAIALDESGIILGANCSAAFQLGERFADLIGRTVESVFDGPATTLLGNAGKQPCHPMAVHGAGDGRRFFAIVQSPACGPAGAGKSVSAGAGTSPQTGPQDSRRCPLDRLNLGDPLMARNILQARKVLDRRIPVLLYGETGTGKGVFAKAFHEAGERAAKPFVAVNCASIPENLIESELFGYRAGAFTGANRRGSRGKILQADGGTLFLDEIGDMPLHLQARLLRVLEEKEVVPLGGDAPERVDIAVISATHRDLVQLIAEGQFREDLYYRLHGIALTLPPLRERHDCRALVREILRRETRNGAPIAVADDALDLLCRHRWPGNIRQLCNTLRTTAALCEDSVIRADDLPDELHGTSITRTSEDACCGTDGPAYDPLARAERTALLHELRDMRWNVAKLARKLNVSRNTLYRKMKRYDIRPPR